MLLRAILSGSVWNGFLLGRAKKVLAGFVEVWMVMVISFGSVPFSLTSSPSRISGIILSSCHLMKRDQSKWPRCLLWHGWLPGISSLCQRDPWAASFGQLADLALGSSLGAYPAGDAHLWVAPAFWDADDLALEMVYRSFLWTDGCREMYPVGGFEVAGSGVYFPAPEAFLLGWVRGVFEEYGDERVDRCRAFMSVPGPFQSVQRAGALLWLFRIIILFTLALIILMLLVLLVGCLIMGPYPSLFLWSGCGEGTCSPFC